MSAEKERMEDTTALFATSFHIKTAPAQRTMWSPNTFPTFSLTNVTNATWCWIPEINSTIIRD